MMSEAVAWSGATTWTAGEGAFETSLRALSSTGTGGIVLMVDGGWAATSAGASLLNRMRRGFAAPPVDEVVLRGPVTPAALCVLADRWRRARATSIVAAGGGTVIDAACLSALPEAQLGVPAFRRGRCGLVVLGSDTRPALSRLIIPTTIGTGAEISSTACCDGPDGKLLVLGRALRPEFAAVLPAATQGLPGEMLREAVVEVLARILVPFAAVPPGARGIVRVADAHALADLHTLARTSATGLQRGFDDETRLSLAAVSAHSHAGWGTLGRGLFASPLWFVATELSAALGVTKARATALLLPAWSGAVLAGDLRWGCAERLRAGWTAVVSGHVDGGGEHELWPDPRAGLGRFCAIVHDAGDGARSGLEGDADIAVRVATTCLRRWGAGLPMLGSFDADALASFVLGALRNRRSLTAVGRERP